jgi:acetate kinase
LVEQSYGSNEVADVPAAMHAAGSWLRETQKLEPGAVGHRVVH